MKKVSLRPYPGAVWLCQSRDEFRAAHKKLTKLDFTAEIYGGVEELIESPKEGFVGGIVKTGDDDGKRKPD